MIRFRVRDKVYVMGFRGMGLGIGLVFTVRDRAYIGAVLIL